MDWDDIRVFLALVRTRRLGPAARSIGQNATTVARRMHRLEAELQATLFEIGPGGYALTEAGRALASRAEIMETQALDAERAISGAGADVSGSIRISVSEGFGSRVLAPRLPAFSRKYPGVTIDLIASTGFLNPSRREADLAIMLSRPQRGPLLVRKLTDYRLGLYASPDYSIDPSIRTIGDLVDKPLIGYVPDLIYAPELHYLEELDARLRATIRSSSILAQSELIRAGAGCGVLPCFIGDDIRGIHRLLIDDIAISRTFWLVVHRDMRKVARIERFISWLDELILDIQPLLIGNQPGSMPTVHRPRGSHTQ